MPGGKRPHRLSSGSDIQCRSPVPEALLIEAGEYQCPHEAVRGPKNLESP